MNEFSIFDVAAAGMEVQRGLLDLAARNVAAAQVGGTFERLVPRFAVRPLAEQASGALFERGNDGSGGVDAIGVDDGAIGVDDGAIGMDDGAIAGSEGSTLRLAGAVPVRGGEADAITEMVAVLGAQRAYEANASVFDAGKRLAERTIDLGRL